MNANPAHAVDPSGLLASIERWCGMVGLRIYNRAWNWETGWDVTAVDANGEIHTFNAINIIKLQDLLMSWGKDHHE